MYSNSFLKNLGQTTTYATEKHSATAFQPLLPFSRTAWGKKRRIKRGLALMFM